MEELLGMARELVIRLVHELVQKQGLARAGARVDHNAGAGKGEVVQ